MRRYWWPKEVKENEEELLIDGELFKHIFKVCRRVEGDQFELLDEHKAHFVEVIEVSKKKALVKVKSSRVLSPLKKPHVHLVLSFSNPKVIDRVLEKSVELGVKSFQLVATENSFIKDQKKLELKTDRAKKIIKQAMQQSGRGEALDLKSPLSLRHFFEDFDSKKNNEGFMFYESDFKTTEALSFDRERLSSTDDIYILIGSEGGFTADEAELAQSFGFKVLSLGEQILRVETACVASISILKSSFGIW